VEKKSFEQIPFSQGENCPQKNLAKFNLSMCAAFLSKPEKLLCRRFQIL